MIVLRGFHTPNRVTPPYRVGKRGRSYFPDWRSLRRPYCGQRDALDAGSHLHFLVTGGGVDKAGLFHKIPRLDDSRLAELFAREVLGFLVYDEGHRFPHRLRRS